MSAGCARLLCLAFFAFGAGFLYLTTIQPLWDIWHAKTWIEAPCRILSSNVKRNSGGRGTTYSVAIRYAYQFEGQNYESDRYNFFLGSSSGYTGKKKIVDRYSPGSEAICFVNPQAPGEAVLQRGPTMALWWGLLPMVFVVIGLCAFLPASVFTRLGTKTRSLETTRPGSGSPVLPAGLDNEPGSLVELRASTSPRGRLIGGISVAVFWNGILSIFVGVAWNAIEDGHPEWFLNIILIPFVVIGIGLLGGALRSFLSLFNPRPVLQVSSSVVALGDALDVQWSFRGNTRRLRNLKIVLEGAERATYLRGKYTSTDEQVFAKLPLVETTDPASIGGGSGSVMIPAELMHSFKAQNNEIVWKLKVHGEIPWYSDVNEEYPLTVLPRPLVKL